MNYFIFDIDGTLINTFDMYMPALFTTLANHGITFSTEKQERLAKQMYGLAALSSLKTLGVPGELIPKINREWMERAYERVEQTTVISGIPAILRTLDQKPENQLAIVSSKTRLEYQQYFKNKYDFARYFAVTVMADDTSKHKPNPEPIEYALRKMGADPQKTVYIGDMATDMQAAHAAGIKFAGARYGSVNPAAIARADFELNVPADLLSL